MLGLGGGVWTALVLSAFGVVSRVRRRHSPSEDDCSVTNRAASALMSVHPCFRV